MKSLLTERSEEVAVCGGSCRLNSEAPVEPIPAVQNGCGLGRMPCCFVLALALYCWAISLAKINARGIRCGLGLCDEISSWRLTSAIKSAR